MKAASVLFAEKGFEVVSVREITTLAKANVASVKYHFGSREGLIDAVVALMAKPVNDERLGRIEGLEERGGGNGSGINCGFLRASLFAD